MTKNKIEVHHSHIIINNYELGDCGKLEYFFSIYDKLSHQYYFKGLEYISETKQLLLPRGIDLYFLQKMFNSEPVIDTVCDKYDKFSGILIRYMPRNDVQSEVLRFMLGEGEYSNTKQLSQMAINLNTGAGKTYVTIATIAYLSIKSIVIASTVNWLHQWKNCLLEYTDMDPKDIVIISGEASIIKLFNGVRDRNSVKIYLATHTTLRNYGEKYGWDTIRILFKNLKIGIKVYDEAHLNFDNIIKIDFYTNTHITYYLTATPARSDESENDIFHLYFKNVLSIDLFNVDEDPRTRYIGIRYKSGPTASEIGNCKNQYGLDRNKYTNYIVTKPNFYKLLHIILGMIKKINGKTLIYIGTNSAICTIHNWIVENYPELKYDIGVFTSMVKDDKYEQLNKRIILSTTKSAGTAVDIKGLKLTIVLAEPFKSEVLARQSLGRTRDNNTLYIDIVDDSFVYCRNYYKYKKPIFDKYAIDCSEIVLSPEELDIRANGIIKSREQMYPNGYSELMEFMYRIPE